jgi:hypothetical protein
MHLKDNINSLETLTPGLLFFPLKLRDKITKGNVTDLLAGEVPQAKPLGASVEELLFCVNKRS